jgi:MATE family multidrug resistance protein
MCAGLIVQTLIMCSIIFLLYWQERVGRLSYSLFDKIYFPDWIICKSIFTLGLPIGIQFGGELAAMTVATYLMGYFGATALAAAQLVGQYFMIFIMLTLGLTQALSILTSEAFGKKDLTEVKEYLRASLLILIILCSFASILFLFFPVSLIHFYMSSKVIDDRLQYLVIIFFAINAGAVFFDGMRHLLSGALRGLHDSQTPMRIGIIAMWFVALPMCYLASMVYHGGPIGLRLGFSSGFIFAVITLGIRMRKKLFFLTMTGNYQ